MAYGELVGSLALPSSSALSLASASVVQTNVVGVGMRVRRFGFQIKTATVSNVDIVVKLKQYPIASSSANAVTLATLTIPTGIAAGAIYYKELDSVKIVPGNGLVVEVTTAAGGGGAAGDGYAFIEGYHHPEDPRNVSVMVLSA
jgi:hypothetical protein